MAILEAVLLAVGSAGKISKTVEKIAHALDSDRSVVLIVENATQHPLERVSTHHDHGGFVETPAIAIPPMSVGVFSSGDIGLATGTVGQVVYRLRDDKPEDTVLEINWANPFIGTNKATGFAWANGGKSPHKASTIYKGAAVAAGGDKKVEMRYSLLKR
ncbi:MAG TPA: hypothetical protein VFX51_07335 [Solirubrobacteraceae bacterium]|nr:hypothetical protein [Solirubrobacteraceae bacterium]